MNIRILLKVNLLILFLFLKRRVNCLEYGLKYDFKSTNGLRKHIWWMIKWNTTNKVENIYSYLELYIILINTERNYYKLLAKFCSNVLSGTEKIGLLLYRK